MNYEELLSEKQSKTSRPIEMPWGTFGKQLIDKKYLNVVELRKDLVVEPKFLECLDHESIEMLSMKEKSQISFVRDIKEGNGTTLVLPSGNLIPLQQLLIDTPAIVAQHDVVDEMVEMLFAAVEALHEKHIFHLCFAPTNVFVRKGDNKIMLLCHGSFYLSITNQNRLYDGYEEYLAPEVFNNSVVDRRSDVYSIGKLITYLYSNSSMPLAYKRLVKKATMELPEDRFVSVAEMRKALRIYKYVNRSLLYLLVAAAMAVCIYGAYVSLVPEAENVEFVKPVVEQQDDDLLDKGFNEETEFGVNGKDTIAPLTPEERKLMDEYEAKCEQIFREQYEKEAEAILSKIYNRTAMNSSEKAFLAGSHSTMEELLKAQVEIAAKAGLTDSKSQRIATEIVEKITERKKAEMKKAATGE